MIDEETFVIGLGVLADPEVHAIPCGSRFVCDPPVMDTDIDYCLYSKKRLDSRLLQLGFTGGERYWHRDSFVSWRRGNHNFIVTDDETLFQRWKFATYVCKTLNIRNKNWRVKIYHAIVREEGYPR